MDELIDKKLDAEEYLLIEIIKIYIIDSIRQVFLMDSSKMLDFANSKKFGFALQSIFNKV
jgi:hypothetical protein